METNIIKSGGKVRILNCIPSPKKEMDWNVKSARDAGMVNLEAVIPASLDLRENWWRIGNQGDTGSCVGWAAADSVIRWHFVKKGMIRKRQELSVRFIWIASKETDEFTTRPSTFIEEAGTSLKAALDIARKYGTVLEKVLPFRTCSYKGKEIVLYALAAQRKIGGYFNLGTPSPDNPIEPVWKTWLATNGPILTRLDVDQTWDNATQTNGILDTYLPATARGGHAVAIVGYTPDHFIIRNSWGTDWGSYGFALASYEYAKAAFTESYGIFI
jgi:hypothetical protein